MEFVALPNNIIQISVNGKIFTNFHSPDLSQITQLYINGKDTVQILSLTLYPNDLKPTIKTDAPATPPPICPNPIVLNNVPLPSKIKTINLVQIGFGKGFEANKRIIFKGVPLQGAKQITIDFGEEDGLMFETANVPLHFNTDLISNVVHLSSWSVDGGWDADHQYYDNPFKVGEPFILEFFAESKNSIFIYVNNTYFATFYYYSLKGYHDFKNVGDLYFEGFRLDSLIMCTNEYGSTKRESTSKTITTWFPAVY
ncbi:unnamed protein product [Meloidogyne enterolobii]|uniref:Uncharacterized protein n=1 Tax=Meloidogyne enterolobii TaxID=390850 RepID=A0ACB0YWF8_MELEN